MQFFFCFISFCITQRQPRNDLNGIFIAMKRKLSLESESLNPFGILPLGNRLFSNAPRLQIGPFALLEHDLLLIILSQYFEIPALIKLSQCSKFFYAFCNAGEVWRTIYLDRYSSDLQFTKSWRHSAVKRIYDIDSTISAIDCKVYSDALYTSMRCATTPLEALCNPSFQNIDRRSNLSTEDFITQYAIPNKPVIIKNIVDKWPAFTKWSFDFFLKECGDRVFVAESVSLKFKEYHDYMINCNEESPLYLFDKNFAKETSLGNDFTTPAYFSHDLFKLLDNRPDFQWIIMGPKRSGSTFHIGLFDSNPDPNSTSAWNAVIKGRKKWVLYPPHQSPPGVFAHDNGSNVTSPVSLAEWYLNFYKPGDGIECVCEEGELLFVPSRWWHSVMNLEGIIQLIRLYCNHTKLR